MSILDAIRWLFSRQRRVPEMPEVALRPIGVVRNGARRTAYEEWAGLVSEIAIRPEMEDALLGLETYSHVIVLFWPHQVLEEARGSKHRLHPRDDPANPLQGVLATRSQVRFNPVLATPVRLLGVKRNVLRVRGLDAIDGTPVLDVKPYIPQIDCVPEATVPEWVRGHVPSGGAQSASARRGGASGL